MTITTLATTESETPPLDYTELKKAVAAVQVLEDVVRLRVSKLLWSDGLHELKPGDVVIVHEDNPISTLAHSIPWIRVYQYPKLMKPTDVYIINKLYLNIPYSKPTPY